jgi:hypothetical protein
LKGLVRNDQNGAKTNHLAPTCGDRDHDHNRHHDVDDRTFALVSSEISALSCSLFSLMKLALCPALMVLLVLLLLYSVLPVFVATYSALMSV